MRQKNNVLRVYFVGDEEGGEAFLAYTAKDAKRFAWNCTFTDFSGEWTDISARWIKDARMEHVVCKPDGLKTGAFGPSPYQWAISKIQHMINDLDRPPKAMWPNDKEPRP
jgi:hypothetical protein